MENIFDDFFNYDPRKDLESFSKVPTETWIKLGEQKALENFQLAAKAVPAYKDFLKKHKIKPEKIKTIEDFKQLPLTTKENYFKMYSLNNLVMEGDLKNTTTIHSSSGSTGKPFYWPKSPIQDVNTYKGVELLYMYYYDIDTLNTLLINCFGMGPWPAGETVHTSTKAMGDKGRKIAVISPGLHVDLILRFFEDLADEFDQIVFAGYPSFLRDVVDEGTKRGVNFKKHNIKILTGGEKFSENWRVFMSRRLGFSRPYRSIASVLGSAETGVTSISTPFADSFRMFLHRNKKLSKRFFTREDLPSITQFIPPARYVEIVDEKITVTCLGYLPLIRYNTNDYGQIITPQDILLTLPKDFGEEYNSLKERYGIPNLPVLSIHGRCDGVVTLYALNIYPEQITYTLESPSVKKYATGRVVIRKKETKKSEPYLMLTLELKPKVKATEKLKNELKERIATGLAKINSEYSHLLKTYGSKVKPFVELKEYGCSEVLLDSGKSVSLR